MPFLLQALKLKTIVRGDAPTSLVTTGLCRKEVRAAPWHFMPHPPIHKIWGSLITNQIFLIEIVPLESGTLISIQSSSTVFVVLHTNTWERSKAASRGTCGSISLDCVFVHVAMGVPAVLQHIPLWDRVRRFLGSVSAGCHWHSGGHAAGWWGHPKSISPHVL